jgi:hypothetical protein
MNKKDIEQFENSIGQMEGLHTEISALARRSPNDPVNIFTLKVINSALAEAHEVLGLEYKPVKNFDVFDADGLPTNSDVTFILAQYLEEIERKRADNIYNNFSNWYYQPTAENESLNRTAPPKKIAQRK